MKCNALDGAVQFKAHRSRNRVVDCYSLLDEMVTRVHGSSRSYVYDRETTITRELVAVHYQVNNNVVPLRRCSSVQRTIRPRTEQYRRTSTPSSTVPVNSYLSRAL